MAPRRKLVQPRADSWENFASGLGTDRDKRTAARAAIKLVSHEEAETLWEADDMAARIVESEADDMLREGFEVQVQGDTESVDESRDRGEECGDFLRELGASEALEQALYFRRAYGGAGVFLGVNDGVTDLRQPLDPKRIRSLDFLTVFRPREMWARAYYGNPLAKGYGRAMIWQIRPDMMPYSAVGAATVAVSGIDLSLYQQVHESRFLIFQGDIVSRRQVVRNLGWGNSAFVRVADVIRDFQSAWANAGGLLQDFAQAVFKFKRLWELVQAGEEGAKQFKARLAAMDLARSTIRAIPIDAEEDFKREPTPIGGLPELLDRFSQRLAAAARMPVTMLMGQAPAGLSATGEGDRKQWYDQVRAQQRRILKPALTRLMALAWQSLGDAPDNWSVKFNPLSQPTQLEEAQRRLAVAQADGVYMDRQTFTPEEIAVSRAGGDEYSPEYVLDMKARATMANAQDKAPAQDPTAPTPPPGQKPAPGGALGGSMPPRTDAFNPDQPRDEKGRWGEGGDLHEASKEAPAGQHGAFAKLNSRAAAKHAKEAAKYREKAAGVKSSAAKALYKQMATAREALAAHHTERAAAHAELHRREKLLRGGA